MQLTIILLRSLLKQSTHTLLFEDIYIHEIDCAVLGLCVVVDQFGFGVSLVEILSEGFSTTATKAAATS